MSMFCAFSDKAEEFHGMEECKVGKAITTRYEDITNTLDQVMITEHLVVNQIFNWFVVTSFLSYFHLSHSRSFLHSVVYFLQDVGNRIKSMSDFFRPTAKS